ncbi:gamma carbonic anhydrase family protein [Aureimonas altamirensis]|uniref:gamma carbonic anhydrase family protein n=1 Tax=Aureimonas altamirensis TaxID=370622 RepID=UPI001E441E7A|nr:gamma carbonic anhydrase family protein [Aureimonas altamirensis]UHD45777.1 gamma carbonic anhydrase family protein [Aureimonas altamirensis]
MNFSYGGHAPSIDPDAWVAPDATVCGNVTIGSGCRVLPGARIVAEAGGAIQMGRYCIVLENAVIRATPSHACVVGDHCLFGPHSHVVGARIDDEVFVATGASIFHGAVVGRGAEIRVNGTVHLKSRLEAGATVPIGWVAVGDPAQIMSPDRHDEIWAIQKPLDFPGFVYGFERSTPGLMRHVTTRLSEACALQHP